MDRGELGRIGGGLAKRTSIGGGLRGCGGRCMGGGRRRERRTIRRRELRATAGTGILHGRGRRGGPTPAMAGGVRRRGTGVAGVRVVGTGWGRQLVRLLKSFLICRAKSAFERGSARFPLGTRRRGLPGRTKPSHRRLLVLGTGSAVWYIERTRPRTGPGDCSGRTCSTRAAGTG